MVEKLTCPECNKYDWVCMDCPDIPEKCNCFDSNGFVCDCNVIIYCNADKILYFDPKYCEIRKVGEKTYKIIDISRKSK